MTDSSKLADTIAALGLGVDAAEFHGGICGLLCASGPGAASVWVRESGDAPSPIGDGATTSETLREVEAACWSELSGAELAFYPLLPDSEAALGERVNALAAWCQGFVTGLGLGGYGADSDDFDDASGGGRAQVDEIVADFVEISLAAPDDDEPEPGAQADFDLAALVEYVRVGAQLIFEELEGQRALAPPRTR
ncbi:MAG TPA: UPF0149 family protein [Gammaproteobacteria bacterium]|nr:UPF0149 family protein [Gammaproteobacteria bacterium]